LALDDLTIDEAGEGRRRVITLQILELGLGLSGLFLLLLSSSDLGRINWHFRRLVCRDELRKSGHGCIIVQHVDLLGLLNRTFNLVRDCHRVLTSGHDL
jgi:hypothetical protein